MIYLKKIKLKLHSINLKSKRVFQVNWKNGNIIILWEEIKYD